MIDDLLWLGWFISIALAFWFLLTAFMCLHRADEAEKDGKWEEVDIHLERWKKPQQRGAFALGASWFFLITWIVI